MLLELLRSSPPMRAPRRQLGDREGQAGRWPSRGEDARRWPSREEDAPLLRDAGVDAPPLDRRLQQNREVRRRQLTPAVCKRSIPHDNGRAVLETGADRLDPHAVLGQREHDPRERRRGVGGEGTALPADPQEHVDGLQLDVMANQHCRRRQRSHRQELCKDPTRVALRDVPTSVHHLKVGASHCVELAELCVRQLTPRHRHGGGLFELESLDDGLACRPKAAHEVAVRHDVGDVGEGRRHPLPEDLLQPREQRARRTELVPRLLDLRRHGSLPVRLRTAGDLRGEGVKESLVDVDMLCQPQGSC
mmetsp:Transcript_8984/g.27305  ORF Transcript_8984/g.27305 Transcript_8984/m.27305 type:complete len:305 (-) Transcript_8984:388-1302(-)